MLRVVMENEIDLELGVLYCPHLRFVATCSRPQALMHDWLAAQASQMMQGIEGQNPFF